MTSLQQALADAALLRETLPQMADSLAAMRFWLTVLVVSSIVLSAIAITACLLAW